MIQIIIWAVILYILWQLFFTKENFSGDIADNEFPDKQIIQQNNVLNNLYRQRYLTNDIVMENDKNTNKYYQDQIDFQKRGQYGLLKPEDINYGKYYEMYKHQLNCPCDNGKERGFDNCENDLDVFKISNLALTNNKNKPCVSCNFDETIGAVLTPEQKKYDQSALKRNALVNNNVEKFAEYKEFVNQDSNLFETQVDKLGQCRTSETCELSKFGETIWDAYDNLLSTDFTKYQTRTNPDILTGASSMTFSNNYETIPSIDYNIDKQL